MVIGVVGKFTATYCTNVLSWSLKGTATMPLLEYIFAWFCMWELQEPASISTNDKMKFSIFENINLTIFHSQQPVIAL